MAHINFLYSFNKNKIFDKRKLKDDQQDFLNHLNKYTFRLFLFEPIDVISMNDVD